jgi:hypothetical protein
MTRAHGGLEGMVSLVLAKKLVHQMTQGRRGALPPRRSDYIFALAAEDLERFAQGSAAFRKESLLTHVSKKFAISP